jgi:hypothetical protein
MLVRESSTTFKKKSKFGPKFKTQKGVFGVFTILQFLAFFGQNVRPNFDFFLKVVEPSLTNIIFSNKAARFNLQVGDIVHFLGRNFPL